MRHIPEDELHAYLDQALSRTQCVEIESHLADCASCRATRTASPRCGTGPRRCWRAWRRLGNPARVRSPAEACCRGRDAAPARITSWPGPPVWSRRSGSAGCGSLTHQPGSAIDVRRGPRVRHGGAYPSSASIPPLRFPLPTQFRGHRALAPVAGGASGRPISSAHGEAVSPARGRRALASSLRQPARPHSACSRRRRRSSSPASIRRGGR
jgi:hypothetical protein